jgi:hypothetical protein
MIANTQNIGDLRQWLCWRQEERMGKLTKIPYSPVTGDRASSTNPETWTCYQEALRACKEQGYGGIGFVFTPEDNLCGVDLDGCLNPETGEVEGWAQEIIDELDSYTEISPSGTGVHILVIGELPEGRNRKGRFETYDRGRYFTVTGKHLSGTPQSIESRQEELHGVVQRMFGGDSANGHGEPVVAAEPVDNGLSDTEIVQIGSLCLQWGEVCPSVDRRYEWLRQSLGGGPGSLWNAGVLDRRRRHQDRRPLPAGRALSREVGPGRLPEQNHSGSSKWQDRVL